jgi:hypothetical protein
MPRDEDQGDIIDTALVVERNEQTLLGASDARDGRLRSALTRSGRRPRDDRQVPPPVLVQSFASPVR